MTIIIKNSYEGGALPADDDGIPFSTKAGDGHGLGLKLIRRMAQRYHGEIEFLCGPEEVELRVLLQEK